MEKTIGIAERGVFCDADEMFRVLMEQPDTLAEVLPEEDILIAGRFLRDGGDSGDVRLMLAESATRKRFGDDAAAAARAHHGR